MSPLFISLFFGAGVAGFFYSKLGRRVGYGNAQSVWLIVGATFLIATVVGYTLMVWVFHFK